MTKHDVHKKRKCNRAISADKERLVIIQLFTINKKMTYLG